MKNIRILGITVATIVVFAILNYILIFFESQSPDGSIDSWPNSIWFMIVTLTTVGYGDFFPITTGGRVIGYIFVLSSLGVLSFLFSTISNKIMSMIEEKKMGFHGTRFQGHIIFVGWNEFSRLVAEEIVHTAQKMAIITNRKDDIDLIYDQYGRDGIFVLFSEFSNREALDKVNATEAKVIFVNLEDDSETLLYVLNFKKKYPQPQVVVSLQKSQLKETFYAAGVTYVIARNDIASKLVASYIFEADVADLNIDLISSSRKETDFDIQQYKVVSGNPLLKCNCAEAFHLLRDRYDVIMLAISKHNQGKKKLITNPSASVKIEEEDYIIIMGNGIAKKKIKSDFGVSEGRG